MNKSSSRPRETKAAGFDPHALLEKRLRERRKQEGIPDGVDPSEPISSEVFSARALCEVSASRLVANARAISELVPGRALLPMVKANAYGHGASWAVTQLLGGLDSIYAFGVASLEEGAELREEVPLLGRRRIPIVAFSGTGPFTSEKGAYCEHFGLTPVLYTEEDFRRFLKEGWAARVQYHLKFNTGMNRLGLPVESIQRVRSELSKLDPEQRPQGVLSHLAMAEAADSALTRKQVEKFTQIRRELEPVSPASQFHLANSSAIWNAQELGISELTDLVRPGLALYGVTPWGGAPMRGISPVLRLSAEVVQVHTLKAGESVGYGAQFKVPGSAQKPVRVAILNCGYADGLPRLLKGVGGATGGQAWLGGRAVRFLGVISMDMSAVECGDSVRPGDRAELLGPQIDPWTQAQAAQTIPYELLTSITARVRRREGP